MRRAFVSLLVTALVATLVAVVAPGVGSHEPATLQFETMAPVTGPFVGTANPIRGVNGGGFPWQIQSAQGVLTGGGHLEVHVRGLVLLDGPPVPPDKQGTNPIPNFRAIVSCETIAGGSATVVNVATDPFPASPDGDASIVAAVAVPRPCIAPIVFVGPNGTTWFAATGA